MSFGRGRQHRFGRTSRVIAGGVAALAALAGPLATFAGPLVGTAHAAGGIIISEVAPWGSGNSPYAADWFEITNTSASAVNITGWKMDDDSSAFGSSVPMTGITSIAAGESVIFLESSASNPPATVVPAFKSFWFGATPPAGLQVGTYTGSGVGLSTSGDAVALFNSTGTLQAKVTFGAASPASPFASFDNAAGVDNGAISTLSAVGVHGAFQVTSSPNSAIGSPGTIVNGTTIPTTTTTTAPSTTTTTAPSTALPWPGDQTVHDASSYIFNGNLSGLIEEGSGGSTPGILWGVRNGPGTLFRLVWDGTKWSPDTTANWGAGKNLNYPDGTGDPDSEGVTFAGPTAANGIFVSTERNNDASSTSKLSVLRFDPSGAGTSLDATMEWNLTADLPSTGANLGLEGITWVPDSYLVANNFFDEHALHTYNPAEYADHGSGLFFVGVEGSGMVYGYALNQVTGGFTRVASFSSSFPAVMELQFDRDLNELWAVCDNTCNGQHALFRINTTTGKFQPAFTFNRPTGMPNYNNEGFAIAPATECVNDRKPVYWADDTEDLGVSIRSGNLPCTAFTGGVTPVVPEFPTAALPVLMAIVMFGGFVVFARRRQPLQG